MKKSKLYYLDPDYYPATTKNHGTLWLRKGRLLVSVSSGAEVTYQTSHQHFTPVDNEETPAGTTSDPVD